MAKCDPSSSKYMHDLSSDLQFELIPSGYNTFAN